MAIAAFLVVLTLAGSAPANDSLFAPPVSYGAGDAPLSVFTADFDGDNDNDLVVANGGSDNVSILFNLTNTPVAYTKKLQLKYSIC